MPTMGLLSGIPPVEPAAGVLLPTTGLASGIPRKAVPQTHTLIICASSSQQLSVSPFLQLLAPAGVPCRFKSVRLPSVFTTVMPTTAPFFTVASKPSGLASWLRPKKTRPSWPAGSSALWASVGEAESAAAVKTIAISSLLLEDLIISIAPL